MRIETFFLTIFTYLVLVNVIGNVRNFYDEKKSMTLYNTVIYNTFEGTL